MPAEPYSADAGSYSAAAEPYSAKVMELPSKSFEMILLKNLALTDIKTFTTLLLLFTLFKSALQYTQAGVNSFI